MLLLISTNGLYENTYSFPFVGIFIGVVLKGELAVRFLKFIIGCVGFHSQKIVVRRFLHHFVLREFALVYCSTETRFV